ncbi:MAG: hypothetical protein ABSG94_11375 [Brevinematales bacterium]|jgi:hypothetical protein
MKGILFSIAFYIASAAFTAAAAWGELREVTFYNPPYAMGTVSFQELHRGGNAGGLIAVKTYYYRAKNPKILDRIIVTGETNNIIRIFDCDFFGFIHNPRYLCIDGDYNIIMENEKAVYVQPFAAAERVAVSNFYSAGVLVKTMKIINECSNALKYTGRSNCMYVW